MQSGEIDVRSDQVDGDEEDFSFTRRASRSSRWSSEDNVSFSWLKSSRHRHIFCQRLSVDDEEENDDIDTESESETGEMSWGGGSVCVHRWVE